MGQGGATRRQAADRRRTGVLPAPFCTAPARVSRRARPGRRAAGGRWPRLALLGVVLAVASGVLLMHDLTQPTAGSHPMASMRVMADEHHAPLGEAAAGDATSGSPAAHAVVAASTASAWPSTHSDGMGGCASCDHHPSVMALCVLTLTLLLLIWPLPRLCARMAPPTATHYRPSWVAVVRQPRPLSLAELAVCRT